ncbi:MAG TPA: hypothetical protein PLK91_03925 [Sphaerochaeta sp.]|jgi:hypothetical protein|nr:hypothetical protein [Spirochaetota bacterium]NLV60391.1 hypothetical protein [Spirochaetales bacterium]HOE84350.1 hypothetical protein [Sphaerochaeta sp.]HOQ94416.1 hypothetical protein [Sphaerochaeta sp.]HPK46961.1 hypothetical protein [Sphaerochaeta sp.]
MRKRVLAMLVLLCVLIPASLGARSLASVSLGFGASYLPDDDLEFSQGLSDPDNWCFHGELSARFTVLQAQALIFPVQCNAGNQGILLIGMGSLSLPMVGSLLSLELGGGVGLTYVPSTSDDVHPSYILGRGDQVETDTMPFGEALYQSPIYLQAALSSELGPVGLRLRYLMKTKTSCADVFGEAGVWSIFNVDSGALSLVLSLKMF